MAWTTPITWANNQLVAAADLNAQVRDNMNYLFSGRPTTATQRVAGSTYSITGSSWADIDSSNLSSTLTVSSGRVLLIASGTFYADASARLARLSFTLDGTRVASGGDAILQAFMDTNSKPILWYWLATGISVGSHTFRPQWNTGGAGTISLFSQTGMPVLFTALEV